MGAKVWVPQRTGVKTAGHRLALTHCGLLSVRVTPAFNHFSTVPEGPSAPLRAQGPLNRKKTNASSSALTSHKFLWLMLLSIKRHAFARLCNIFITKKVYEEMLESIK